MNVSFFTPRYLRKVKFHMKGLTCGRICNKLLFDTAAVEYIVLTKHCETLGRGLLYAPPEMIIAEFGTLKQTRNVH